MCDNPFKPPKPKVPAPAPLLPDESKKQLAPEIASRSDARSSTSSKRKGRSALRIDLQAGSAGAGGSGTNIPRA